MVSTQHPSTADDQGQFTGETGWEDPESRQPVVQLFFDTSPLFLGVAELDGDTIIAVNGNAAVGRLVGLSPEDIPGRTGDELCATPEENSVWVEHYRQSQREGRPVRFELTRGRGNSMLWLSATVNYLGQGPRKRPRFSFIAEDITQHKQLDQALEESERKYRELIQFAPVGIYEIDFRTGKFTSINDSMVDLTGYSREELLQTQALDLLDPESRALFKERIRQWLSGEMPRESVEYRVLAKDGHEIYAVLNVSFTRDEQGNPLGATVVGYDVTERKRSEEVVKASEEMFARVFRDNPAGMSIIRLADRRYTAVNPGFCKLLGYASEEIVGQTVDALGFIPEGQRSGIEQQFYADGKGRQRAMKLLAKNGEQVWVLLSFEPVEIRGEPCILTTAIDISDRVRAEEALRESEERFRKSVETIYENFTILTAVRQEGKIVDFRYEYANQNTCLSIGRTLDEIAGHTIREILPEYVERNPDLTQKYIRVVETGVPMHERVTFSGDGNYGQPGVQRIFDIRTSKLGDGMIVTSNEVTEQALLEADHQKAIQEREIHHRLTEQREKERQSIARDIHDGPIQSLSSLAFSLQFLKEAYADPSLQLEIAQIAGSVKEVVKELRQVMNELRPPNVIRFGLAAAIQLHTENLRERYPRFVWNLDLEREGQLLPEQTCLAMFRIYQEAINNIIRHSEATAAWIRYDNKEDQAILEIADNGIGFANARDIIDLTSNQHFGLAGIVERVQAIEGEFEIHSSPGSGTTIRVCVPLKKQASE